MLKNLRGLMAFVSLLGLTLFLLNCGSSNSRPAGVVFVASQGTSTVGSYAIDLTNGKLTQLNKTADTCQPQGGTCGLPLSMIMDSTGSNLFLLNQGSSSAVPPTPSSIYGYTAASDGTLTIGGDLTTSFNAFMANDLAVSMARDAAGSFLFVVTGGDQDPLNIISPHLFVFGVQSGSLSLLSSKDLTQVPTAVSVGTGPSGLLLYVTNNQDLVGTIDNTVSEFSVDGSGVATELNGSPYPTASDPGAVLAVNLAPVGGSSSLFVYVTNVTTNNITVFKVCTVVNADCVQGDVDSAKMTAVGNPVAVGQDPIAMTIDSTNNFMYVLNHHSNSVSGFRVNQTTGALSALTPATVSTGANPLALSLHPTNEFLYVSNNGSDNISGFKVSLTNGALGSSTTITSASAPSGLVSK